jgi:hypothetical protein
MELTTTVWSDPDFKETFYRSLCGAVHDRKSVFLPIQRILLDSPQISFGKTQCVLKVLLLALSRLSTLLAVLSQR